MRYRAFVKAGCAPVLAIVALAMAVVVAAVAAPAQARPVKLEPAGSIDNGFKFPEGIATAPSGNLYVADTNSSRVQELTPDGKFVLTFGWDVNETKTNEGAPQTERNLCTAESGDKCQEGVQGTDAGQFEYAFAIAVDPGSGDVYVGELSKQVSKYSGGGSFIWRLGKKVNQTTGGNICTAVSKDVCGPGELSENSEHGAFAFEQSNQPLAVGGPEDRLYVGTAGRVQEFSGEGEWKHDLLLTVFSAEPEAKVWQIAASPGGDVYLTYAGIKGPHTLHEFDPEDKEVQTIDIAPRVPGAEIATEGLALDGEGRAVVLLRETYGSYPVTVTHDRGRVFDAASGRLVSEFESQTRISNPIFELAGNPGGVGSHYGYLYVMKQQGPEQEVALFKPVNIAELTTTAVGCVPGATHETDVNVECELKGEVNPWGVPGTEVWFQWGLTQPPGEVAPLVGGQLQPIAVGAGEASVPVSAKIFTARPNESGIYYGLAAFDENSRPPGEPEPLKSELTTFSTPFVAPAVVGEPAVESVTPSSAVLFGELNPENASTRYDFQYAPAAPCEQLEAERGGAVEPGECPEAATTPTDESSVYGRIGTTEQVAGLQPGTAYRYRLIAVAHSEVTKKLETLEVDGPVATLTTAPAPAPSAATGGNSAVGVSSATIYGSIDSGGQAAAYIFELGVFEGAHTQYDIVASGPAGAGSAPVQELAPLTGLQPGTTYAYRIAVKSGYTPGGEEVLGQTETFTTLGLASVLPGPEVAPLLAVPNIVFPPAVSPPGAKQPLTRAQKLAAALKACKRKPKKSRASCQRSARKRYGPKSGK